VLDCDVIRFNFNEEKWVAFVGLKEGRPYEIFTGLAMRKYSLSRKPSSRERSSR
jgi:hypothetical protein